MSLGLLEGAGDEVGMRLGLSLGVLGGGLWGMFYSVLSVLSVLNTL